MAGTCLPVIKLNIDPLTLPLALQKAMEALSAGKRAYAVTPNTETALASLADPKLKNVISNAHLSLCDGTGVFLLSRIFSLFNLCRPVKERVCGIDFAEELVKLCSKSGVRVLLWGARPENVKNAAKYLKKKYPGLIIAGLCDGYQPEPVAMRALCCDKPALLLAALGSPKQEYLISELCKKKGPPLFALAVGGAFDVWAGKCKRAPAPLRKLGFEWLWRFACQPFRAKRFLNTFLDALSALGQQRVKVNSQNAPLQKK